MPSSGGLVKHRVDEMLVLPWNDVEATERLLTRSGARSPLSWSIRWPIAWPSSRRPRGFSPPPRVTRALGILVIFDEVITFRVGYGGAQARYGGEPDLTAFGKIIGGGFPVGATGGRAEVMDVFDPDTAGPADCLGRHVQREPDQHGGGARHAAGARRRGVRRLAAWARGCAGA